MLFFLDDFSRNNAKDHDVTEVSMALAEGIHLFVKSLFDYNRVIQRSTLVYTGSLSL